jgi:endonuclease/exonuclease/phosphatase family metal-dependent hydrolase
MTYNIRLGIQLGVEAIAQIIRDQNPDIVALQEVGNQWRMGPDGDTAAGICEMIGFGHHCYVTTICEDQDHRYGHTLLSRWPIEQRDIVGFSQHIDEPRSALIADITTDEGPIRVISTHLSHRDRERVRHGKELVELVGKHTSEQRPTLLMGDLNEEDDADWVRTLKEGMDSAGDRVDGKTYPNPKPSVLIDYVMVHGGRVQAAQILDERQASDHRPVVADIAFDQPA